MKTKHPELEINQAAITIASFMESYNKTIPVNFPYASIKILKEFQVSHPTLFKHGNEWSIDKHRKKVMDWIPSYFNIS